MVKKYGTEFSEPPGVRAFAPRAGVIVDLGGRGACVVCGCSVGRVAGLIVVTSGSNLCQRGRLCSRINKTKLRGHGPNGRQKWIEFWVVDS